MGIYRQYDHRSIYVYEKKHIDFHNNVNFIVKVAGIKYARDEITQKQLIMIMNKYS